MKKLLVALALLAAAGAALAQAYPSKPVVMVAGFAAGGPTDTIARILAERMRQPLGQAVLVENTAGAAGSIAIGRVLRAAPDGYTVSIGHWSTHVVNGAIYQLPYDLLKDLAPVALVASNPQLLVARSGVPAQNLKELIGWIKANEGKVTAGTAGSGSGSHVGGIYFANSIGAKLQFIPYRGTGPAMQDLVGGQIDIMFDQAVTALAQVRAGRIKAYAVTAKERLAAAPDIPTVDEAGAPGVHIAIWHALWVARGTPREVVMRLNAAVVESLADPAVRKRLGDLGQDIPSREQQTPEALGAHHKAEIEKWWPLIKAAGVKVD
jgi:tripartite-type tricarboxylate transporter receptor subunit TctC